MIGLGYESIHACVNDCFLFWGKDHKDKQFSLVCNTSRWKDNNTSGKKVPKKVLCYFPIIPRLQCLYKSSYTTKEMTWHATRKCTKPGKMKHPVDGRAWKNFDTNSFMLTLLIPCPKSPGKDIDVYLRPLIDDLKDLWAKPGVETIDVATGQKCHAYRKNVLESILNTLLMNDKSKDTTKARQDLKRLGIRSGLWLSQNKNGKCTKPHAAYSFTPGDRKKFCQFIKGVKLPDGFGSNFKHKDDMLKAQSKVIDILCNLELIYPLGFFDIMIHLVIHLPLEALEGGPIHPRWMYPFERFMKKLKNYVQNKAKPKGSIAKGYIAEEALTFSSHYFWDVTTKFNRPDRNVDCPPPTC
ncbi:pyruvate kinase [Tanacetum coccineum]